MKKLVDIKDESVLERLSLSDKVDLLRFLVDDLDLVLTAAYGATGLISSESIEIANENIDYCGIIKDKTVVISTDISTG
jgi:hypothetical protein